MHTQGQGRKIRRINVYYILKIIKKGRYSMKKQKIIN